EAGRRIGIAFRLPVPAPRRRPSASPPRSSAPPGRHSSLGSMENSNLRGLVGEEIFMQTGKAAGIGLAAGSVWGGVVSMLHDGPQVGSNVKHTELIRIGKVCGHYAASFAVIGATYIGVEQALEKYRMKKDVFNGIAAGFATGAVMGFRAGSPRTAFLSGSAIALTSVLLDVTGMRTTEEEKGHH
ncbi:unnamed protein product, partial [Urochloa humidicola]